MTQGKDVPDGAGRALGSRADSPLSKESDITDATKLFAELQNTDMHSLCRSIRQ